MEYEIDDEDENDIPTDGESDQPAGSRTVVAAQLLRLQRLIGRFEHRRRVERSPWGDPHHGQGRVLGLLKLKPEISQRELNYLLDMSKQSLAELLAKLEKAGLITREPSPDDKRVTMVRLTEAGLAADQQEGVSPTNVNELLSVLDDDELVQFSSYLARLIERLEQIVGGPDGDERRAAMNEFLRERGEDDPRLRDMDPRVLAGLDPALLRGRGPGRGPGWRRRFDDFGPGPDGYGPPDRFGPGAPGHFGPEPEDFGPPDGFEGPHGRGHRPPRGDWPGRPGPGPR